jgi:cytochrome c-type biogenesis protein CcmH
MIWVGVVVLAVVCLAPTALVISGRVVSRGRREAALELHRAQLAELDLDLAEGRIGPAEHATAVLEVQRRLLAAAAAADPPSAMAGRSSLWAVLGLVPLAALLLYLAGGSPDMPAAPLSARLAAARKRADEQTALIDKLRQVLLRLDPHSDQARAGYILLGDAEARLGDLPAAAAAWTTALSARFDPTLAAETAEADTEANGRITTEAATLFRRALAEAPPEAPWRPMAEKRLQELDTANGTPASPR